MKSSPLIVSIIPEQPVSILATKPLLNPQSKEKNTILVSSSEENADKRRLAQALNHNLTPSSYFDNAQYIACLSSFCCCFCFPVAVYDAFSVPVNAAAAGAALIASKINTTINTTTIREQLTPSQENRELDVSDLDVAKGVSSKARELGLL